ncbi:hypothetical protein GPECTOR_29g65 [Gonium pectorale]|uniref:Kinesin-like protein n=1 Tax=Gonium pectorale TaxID=33097 RepID=A0A150GEL3_GONPE|nr:hypothetical protein GPECTOR_29g65 [Gonium pectorale]|eukprot:KXZ48289.1 hypothetical protein GPECTOR_29g65 [Gonium pectorale]
MLTMLTRVTKHTMKLAFSGILGQFWCRRLIDKEFDFDNVLDSGCQQADVFTCYNSSILAYGQTGSGKTHTMFGPRLVDDLTDDQAHNGKETKLEIREHGRKGPFVAGLTEYHARNADVVHKLALKAFNTRRTCATERNATSSRSHAIFTISITKEVTSASGAATRFTSKLNLVDLAGSERAASSGGGQLKETCGINSSLVALGRVITALKTAQSEANKPRAGQSGPHVPYRANKLTYLLKESLGGNARTFFIACVSPSAACAQETISTLRFACDARAVRNAARVAVTGAGDPAALLREVEALAQANEGLAAELERLKEAKQQLQVELTERVSLDNTQAAEARAALLAAQRANTKLEQSNAELAVAMEGAQAAAQAARRDAEAERERSAALVAKAAEAEAAFRAALSATSDVEERFRQLELQVAERCAALGSELAQARAELAAAQQAASSSEQRCLQLAAALAGSEALAQAVRRDAVDEGDRAAALTSEVVELRAALNAQREVGVAAEVRCGALIRQAGEAQTAAREARVEAGAWEERSTYEEAEPVAKRRRKQQPQKAVDVAESDSGSANDLWQENGGQVQGLQKENAAPVTTLAEVPKLRDHLFSAAERNNVVQLRQLLPQLKDYGGPNISNDAPVLSAPGRKKAPRCSPALQKGERPLHLACSRGSKDVAIELLDHGADVDAKTKDGLAPLHLASSKGRVEVVKMLLKRWEILEPKLRQQRIDARGKDNKYPYQVAEETLSQAASTKARGQLNAIIAALDKGIMKN